MCMCMVHVCVHVCICIRFSKIIANLDRRGRPHPSCVGGALYCIFTSPVMLYVVLQDNVMQCLSMKGEVERYICTQCGCD